MGYTVYQDPTPNPWAGYGVRAPCEVTGCDEQIDRGMAWECETVHECKYLLNGVEVGPTEEWDEEIEREEEGCYLFFCSAHEGHRLHHDAQPKPDSLEWEARMLTDESWEQWRTENPTKVAAMERRAGLDESHLREQRTSVSNPLEDRRRNRY